MKSYCYLFTIIIVVIVSSSCSKSSSPSSNQNDIKLYAASLNTIQQSIMGKWQLTYMHGGFSGIDTVYTKNEYWQFLNNNRVIETVNNAVVTDTTIVWNYIQLWNTYSMGIHYHYYIMDSILNNVLTIHDYTSEPYYYHFMRIKS